MVTGAFLSCACAAIPLYCEKYYRVTKSCQHLDQTHHKKQGPRRPRSSFKTVFQKDWYHREYTGLEPLSPGFQIRQADSTWEKGCKSSRPRIRLRRFELRRHKVEDAERDIMHEAAGQEDTIYRVILDPFGWMFGRVNVNDGRTRSLTGNLKDNGSANEDIRDD
ncbi:hypothetical protein EV363DRAFT_268024 [Boletus edulis]|nr:hypothetical protein EV363DRAFT_268024 [Boletus edulis]